MKKIVKVANSIGILLLGLLVLIIIQFIRPHKYDGQNNLIK